MPETYNRTVPGIRLRERAPGRVDILRLRRPTPALIAALGEAVGVELPVEPNRAIGTAPRAVWIGPGEWMVAEVSAAPLAWETAMTEATAFLATPVGDGRFAIEAEGSRVREILAGAIPIDLHPAAFPVDHTAMTLFHQVNIIIDHVDPDRFRLWFDISLRGHVLGWFDDALSAFAA